MTTPERWHEVVKRVLKRENTRFEPEYVVKRRDMAGNALEAELFAVSLVHEPLHPSWRIVRSADEDQEC